MPVAVIGDSVRVMEWRPREGWVFRCQGLVKHIHDEWALVLLSEPNVVVLHPDCGWLPTFDVTSEPPQEWIRLDHLQ